MYTWSQASAFESKSHEDLVQLRSTTPFGPSSEEQAFFANPSCSPPSSLMGAAPYRSDCNQGRQYNAATTGLLISSLLVGAAGTASFIVGAHQASRERPVEIRPALSYNEVSLTLRFPF
jgi:hypothetical protein